MFYLRFSFFSVSVIIISFCFSSLSHASYLSHNQLFHDFCDFFLLFSLPIKTLLVSFSLCARLNWPVSFSVQIIYHIESYRIWFRHDRINSKHMSVTAECNRQTNDCREYNIRQTKHTNSWPVIMWTLSDISNISFCLHLKTTPCTRKNVLLQILTMQIENKR